MGKSRITCHILQSIDGRISGVFFGTPETAPALGEYARIRKTYDCDAVISGAVTAAEIYADGFVDHLLPLGEVLPRTDWKAGTEERYAVIIDGTGTVNWQSGSMERRGSRMHVISILQESVSDAYLALLRKAGVSYIFAGKDTLDLRLAVEKLQNWFGISSMLLSGGGVVDYAFLQAGLVDEVSLVVTPVVDGGLNLPTAFDASRFTDGTPVSMELLEVKTLAGNALWLRYRPLNRR